MTSPGPIVGRILILIAAVLWSLGGVATKMIELDGSVIAFYRGLFAGLALFPFVNKSHYTFRIRLIPLIILFGGMTGLYIGAIKLTTAANAIFLQCSAAFWLVPLSYFFLNERPDKQSLVGITLASFGIIAIVCYGYDPNRPGELRGVLMALGSGIAYAGVVIGLRGLRDCDATWLSAINNFFGAIVLGIIVLFFIGPIGLPKPNQAVGLVAFGVVQMAIPYILFARGLRVVPAAEAGLLALLEPILSPVWVWAVVGEQPRPATLVGGGLLLFGVICRYVPLPNLKMRRERIGDAPLAESIPRDLS